MEKQNAAALPDFYHAMIQAWQDIGRKNPFTSSAKELETYIHELKTVEFWLQSNQQLLHQFIQALEMQATTLHALQPWEASENAKRKHTPTPDDETCGTNLQSWWQLLQNQFAQVTQLALNKQDLLQQQQPPPEKQNPEKQKSRNKAKTRVNRDACT